MERKCKIEGCEKTGPMSLGLCRMHYMRYFRTGDPAIVRKAQRGDGRRKHPLYGAWAGMVNRCTNPNHSSYYRYGGAGVTVCDRWRSDFRAFLEDMGERPEGMTLDRIDPTGPYSPENCRWATASEQARNLSEKGDKRRRAALSEAKKAYWEKWRQNPERLKPWPHGCKWPPTCGKRGACQGGCSQHAKGDPVGPHHLRGAVSALEVGGIKKSYR